ncbi:Glyoxalase/Bleomycin resistance protein/Dihydroxybiphenyl dioxygenase [Eremomyces bilateralis CBS 781.70]|uniref:Glyoxalase/Bleomycin resistance protein/Dihydroxybiphenyl dioxygenase n=1 Tax=Eremomyces bilateralis CBS 781.70 TaxID=1392243 RepID=A0A6G1G692_9PEZI|nr:Glyoxalase/Bleomycin resistance protein/Dihydroxybiphenyl dioxygenase [Eremomyces bilateralis CBS 781.70]KAF1813349.1 Glyoxalase/Bleomycin resistance protein/Dihydroxybiphenyl dioxygenase [Eremomyces bilateralis CBS 781.70]
MVSDKIRVVRLSHVHYKHPDLAKAVKFFGDFGLVTEDERDGRTFLRGYGAQPFVHLAEQSPDEKRHFAGGYWVVDSEAELEKAASLPGASSIQNLDAPGGGRVVTVPDPNGNTVGFVYGQTLRSPDVDVGALERKDSGHASNTAVEKPRKGAVRRFLPGASPVHKLGHYGYVVPQNKFEESFSWYTTTINLKPTDAVFDPVSNKDDTVFMHIDLGSQYADHHSFFLAASKQAPHAHVHHSSYEVNDFDTQRLGHDHLQRNGWTNCWGIGRHVLGSQIFDYWFDGSGNVVEHYSDGDLVNEDTPFGREAAAPDSLYVWGPNIPLAFVTGRIEDAGKPIPLPLNLDVAKPAQL